MFFFGFFGIMDKQKNIEYNKSMICPCCGRYSRFNIFMVYTYFHIFFIPIFKWNKRYFAQTVCCNAVYTLSQEIGSAIERGENPEIKDEDLTPYYNADPIRYCKNCGYKLSEEFDYCPKCGSKID